MAFNPTPSQELAINANGSILVSAAAGSGKTAVLVQRVVRLLTHKENPIPADKILVITYTNAAAAELKTRIEKKLNEVIENSPHNPLYNRQKILLCNAKICTIDSFCLDFIRENYETSGLNPSFKIAEASVINNLTTLAINKVFEEYYNANDKDFLELLEFVGSDYDDSKLSDSVLNIFNFSRQMPFPKEWIKGIAKAYEQHSKGLSAKWQEDALDMVCSMINEGVNYIQKACNIIEFNEEVHKKYGENYYYILEFFESFKELIKEKNWDKVFDKACSYAPVKCKALGADYKTKEVEYSKELRDKADAIAKDIKAMIYCDSKELKEEFSFCSFFVNKITEIVCRFEEEFYNLLKEKNLITFYIAEQTTLSMIAEYKDGKIVAKSSAEEFINQYEAVFVDEYQDTNDMQDCLFGILSGNEKKLFSVGDAKQCIYKFRGANPYNFIKKREKYRAFAGAENEEVREIELGCNFRSRKEICEYVNYFFEKLMTKANADIDYNKGEALEPKADFVPSAEPKVETYLLDCKKIIDNGFIEEDDEKIFRIKAEANAIADIIQDTIKKEPFLKEEDGLRKAEYKDITILLRSVANYGEILVEVLKNRGIPVSISAGDLLNTQEAVLLISLLKIINNPFDDIALLNVLTSPLFAFSMEELAKMRITNKKGKFIGAVSSFPARQETKTKEFLKVLSNLRRKSIILGLSELIEEIFETTGLLSIMSEFENGSSRVDNLLSIQSYALSFEEDRKKSLSEFLSALENLRGKDFKSSPGKVSNCVTVMSIHGSKGLQFPICILANMAKNFNFTDLNNHMLIDEKYGFSFNYFDKEKREKSKTLLRIIMSDFEKRQLRAEELRLLYVAMTRAEEKLIMTASYSDLEKSIVSKLSNLYDSEKMDSIDYSIFKKTMSYADWLLLSELISPSGKTLMNYVGLTNKNLEENKPLNEINIIENLRENSMTTTLDTTLDQNAVDHLKEIYQYQYPFEALLGLEAKASVTDIVHKADEKTYQFKTRPAFLSKDGLSGSERGTATHKFMQYCDYSKAVRSLSEEKQRLYEMGFLTENEADAVDLNSLNEFFGSSLFNRIKASKVLKREMRFLTEFSATDLKSELDKSFKSEKIVVQGAVDLLFVEDGKLVIVDFKTDRNKNEDELRLAYKEQLEIYAKACSKLLSYPVGEMIIYSFSLNKSIKL